MRIVTVIFLALFYSTAVFCICSFKKIKIMLAHLFSRRDIKYLRTVKHDSPIIGRDIDEEMKRAMEPVMISWRDADENALPGRMDKNFFERMQIIIRVLKKYGIRRELKLFGTVAESDESNKSFRKWNEGGREWREGALLASALDMYTDSQSGRIISEKYYPDVRISIVQSRHITYEDAKKEAESKKDKFGYTKKKKPETVFYEKSKNIICKSCGAEIEINTQQVTCPYCGGQFFSDFHDWQTEHFAVEPVCEYPFIRVLICAGIAFFASLSVRIIEMLISDKPDFSVAGSFIAVALTVGAISGYTAVFNRFHKKRLNQIVRFSPHQFKSCVYEELWNQFSNLDIVDFFIGDIAIKSVKNSEDTTELTAKIPLFTLIYKNGSVVFEKKKAEGVFIRTRYPERLKSKGAIVEERECPSCAGNFIPDSHGCCSFCGYGLKTSNAKWKLKSFRQSERG